MTETTITKKGQVTIPREVREKLGLKPGDRIVFTVEDGRIIGIPVEYIPKDQMYFWSKEWQKLEKSAENDKKNGRVHEFNDVNKALKWLKEK